MRLKLQGTATYDPATVIGPVRWEDHDLFLVTKGLMRFSTTAGELDLCANDAVWIPPKTRFSAVSLTSSSTIWVVHFEKPNLRPSQLAERASCGVWHFPGAVGDLTSRLMEKLKGFYLGDSLWQRSAEPYFDALLQDLSENAKQSVPTMAYSLDQLTQWARKNLQRKIGVRDLSEKVGLSEAAFRFIFQKKVQQSPGDYLRQLRLNEAARLLLQSSLSIKEICSEVGYSEVAAFHHAFSKYFKVSPGVYRSSRRKFIA